MKIILTGGGTGGHFYPIIAVVDAINEIIEKRKIIPPEIIFMSNSPYDPTELNKRRIRFKKVEAGKLRRYFSLRNFSDTLKTFVGILKAAWSIYLDFPDLIFSKGGYSSLPVVFAARIFGIPLIIHESDAVPGKVNQWSGKFAKKIAISFPQTIKYFPENKTAFTGNPVRKQFFIPMKTGAKEFLKIEEGLPVVFIMGGSQGAKPINDVLIDILPELVKKYQVIHQCGEKNIDEVQKRISIVLSDLDYKNRYRPFKYLNEDAMRMAYGAADLVVSRAGSGSIFEISASGLPSILIPLSHAAQDHQRENAHAYSKTGAAEIIEENNLTPHVLLSEIDRILSNKEDRELMSKAAKFFTKPQAAETIAKEILILIYQHER